MSATHENLISRTITLDAAGVPFQSFGSVAVFVENGTLSYPDGYKVLKTSEAVDGEAGLTTSEKTFLTAALTQLRTPEAGIVVVPVSGALATDYDSAWDTLASSEADFWAVCLADPSNAVGAVALAVKIEASTLRSACLFVQTSDAAAYAVGGVTNTGEDFASVADNERLVFLYDDDDTNPAALAWSAYRLAFDLDANSPAWTGELKNVTPADGLTQTQADQILENNINVALPFYGASARVATGVTAQGRAITDILFIDWLYARAQENWAQLVLDRDRAGQPVPLNFEGQLLLGNECIQPVIDTGFATTKFEDTGEDAIDYPSLTVSDIAALRLTNTVEVETIQSAARFRIDIIAR